MEKTISVDFSKLPANVRFNTVWLDDISSVSCGLREYSKCFKVGEDDDDAYNIGKMVLVYFDTEGRNGKVALESSPSRVAGRAIPGEVAWVNSNLLEGLQQEFGFATWDVMNDNCGAYLLLSMAPVMEDN